MKDKQFWITTTRTLLILVVICLASYDILAMLMGGVEATISRQIYHAAVFHPIIAFAAGVLCGHLFWPQRVSPKAEVKVYPVATPVDRSSLRSPEPAAEPECCDDDE